MSRDLLLDTNTLSEIKNGDIDINQAKNANVNYYIPPTQKLEFLDGVDELPEELRDSIVEVIDELEPEEVQLDSAPYGKVPFGHGPFGRVSETYKELLDRLDEIKEHENNSWDVLGAETAISRDMEFVTNDGALQEALSEYSEDHLLCYNDYKSLVED